jgi:hypothetical protein
MALYKITVRTTSEYYGEFESISNAEAITAAQKEAKVHGIITHQETTIEVADTESLPLASMEDMSEPYDWFTADEAIQ